MHFEFLTDLIAGTAASSGTSFVAVAWKCDIGILMTTTGSIGACWTDSKPTVATAAGNIHDPSEAEADMVPQHMQQWSEQQRLQGGAQVHFNFSQEPTGC